MAELEERPTKIRKLDLEAESNERPQADSAVLEAPEVAFSEAASDQLGSMVEAPPNDSKGASEDQPTLSKSALKKLRKKEQWEAGKEDRKAKRREKHKEKQARKAEERAELEVKIASGEAEITPPNKMMEKQSVREGQFKSRCLSFWTAISMSLCLRRNLFPLEPSSRDATRKTRKALTDLISLLALGVERSGRDSRMCSRIII